jgi:quercetin dioxygenase-like cupin family protein
MAEVTRIPKPWGYELLWAHTERYAGKLLVIEAGQRLSLQYHKEKEESIFVLEGVLRLHLAGDDGRLVEHDLHPHDTAHIPIGRLHRFEAVTRVVLVEASSPELDDVVRVEDDFGREGTSAP